MHYYYYISVSFPKQKDVDGIVTEYGSYYGMMTLRSNLTFAVKVTECYDEKDLCRVEIVQMSGLEYVVLRLKFRVLTLKSGFRFRYIGADEVEKNP